jgi:hypothetical protein
MGGRDAEPVAFASAPSVATENPTKQGFAAWMKDVLSADQ